MNPNSNFDLFSEILDMQIVDCNGCRCGMVDDIELDEPADGTLRIKNLLTGPGAYRVRVPRWLGWIIQKTVGSKVHRIPWVRVRGIDNVVELDIAGEELGLLTAEKKAKRYLPKAFQYESK